MSNFTAEELETARNQELAHITSRNMQVTICALGSTLFSYMIGNYLAVMLLGNSTVGKLLFSSMFVYLAFLAIDWAFLNRLVGASSIRSPQESKRLLRSAYVFLGATLLMSLVSVFFVGNEIKGESNLKTENELLAASEKRDSTVQVKALQVAEQAEANRPQAIRAAKEQGHALVLAAIQKGSRSWQRDFEKAGKDLSHWFYTCRRGKHCPQAYIDYRNGILQARTDSTTLVAQASGQTGNYAQALVLLAADTTREANRKRIAANIAILESERNWKGYLITGGLAILSIFCGILAVQETVSLIALRQRYGQQVAEDNVTSILKIKDLIARIPDTLMDLLYNILIRWWDQAKEDGRIVAYSANKPTMENSQQSRVLVAGVGANNSSPKQQQKTVVSLPHTEPTANRRNQQAKPTGETNSQQCKTNRCAPGGNRTANANSRLAVDTDELVRIRERCRTRFRRWRKYTNEGKTHQAAINLKGAEEDAEWLRKQGANVEMRKPQGRVIVHLPKVPGHGE